MDGDVTRVCRVRAGRAEAFDLPPRDGCDVRDKRAFPSKTDFPPLGGDQTANWSVREPWQTTGASSSPGSMWLIRSASINGQELPPSGQAVLSLSAAMSISTGDAPLRDGETMFLRI